MDCSAGDIFEIVILEILNSNKINATSSKERIIHRTRLDKHTIQEGEVKVLFSYFFELG